VESAIRSVAVTDLEDSHAEIRRLRGRVRDLLGANTNEVNRRRAAEARVNQLEDTLSSTMKFVEETAVELRRQLKKSGSSG